MSTSLCPSFFICKIRIIKQTVTQTKPGNSCKVLSAVVNKHSLLFWAHQMHESWHKEAPINVPISSIIATESDAPGTWGHAFWTSPPCNAASITPVLRQASGTTVWPPIVQKPSEGGVLPKVTQHGWIRAKLQPVSLPSSGESFLLYRRGTDS